MKNNNLVSLDTLKQGATFWLGHGKFEIVNKSHKNGIECNKLKGSFHYHQKGKKLPDTVSEHEKEKIVLPRKTMVALEFKRKRASKK